MFIAGIAEPICAHRDSPGICRIPEDIVEKASSAAYDVVKMAQRSAYCLVERPEIPSIEATELVDVAVKRHKE
ncbi:hypothetical protein GCM10027562_01840 [Arthrobacter pigmenti]